jgi:hypothetical protein
MSNARRLSLARTLAIFLKELIQMRRDRLTLAMMVGIPLVQLVLFGFAINTDPKALPSYVKVEESSRFSRTAASPRMPPAPGCCRTARHPSSSPYRPASSARS